MSKSWPISLILFTSVLVVLSIFAFLPVPPFVNHLLLTIMGASGILVFWQNKDQWLLEMQKPKKEGKYWWVPLAAIALLALVLRLLNLDALEPETDEYAHLIYATTMNIDGGTFYSINGEVAAPYNRGYFITWLASLFFDVFGRSVFVARLPAVLFSSATVIPLYFLGRQIHHSVGWITALLWALSPWAIVTAKVLREYAIFPFFYALMALFFVWVLEKKKWDLKNLIYANLGLILPVIYALVLDRKSTFKLGLMLYGSFFALLLIKQLGTTKWKLKLGQLLGFGALFIGGLYLIVRNTAWFAKFASVVPHYSQPWYQLVLGDWNNTFFYGANAYGYYAIFGAGALFGLYALFKRKLLSLSFALVSFSIYLYVFHFHLQLNPLVRYAFVLHLWLIPLSATGLYLIAKLYYGRAKGVWREVVGVLLTILILSSFNLKNIAIAVDQKNHLDDMGFAPYSDLFHDRFTPVAEKYRTLINPNDNIVCSLCMPLYWNGMVDFYQNNTFTFYPQLHATESKRLNELVKIIKDKPTGWIVLDVRRNSTAGIPHHDFNLQVNEALIHVQFLEKYYDFFIYKWEQTVE